MFAPVLVKVYQPPEICKREVLRYAGVKEITSEIDALITECIREIDGKLTYKVCYSEFPVKISEDTVDLTFTSVKSKHLAANLKGCVSCVVFAATIGVQIDRLIAKYNVISPAKALVFQALGTERIESLCNLFNEEISKKYQNTAPRFSAGYGDLPIEMQRDIFNALDCQKKIGITLSGSMLTLPSKSVTAIIGIGGRSEKARSGCNACRSKDCSFRR